MTRKLGLSALIAALLVSGCASTRGGQDVACEDFEDYALDPKPHAVIRDIQRYSVLDRGSQPDRVSQSGEPKVSMDEMIGQSLFGIGDDRKLEAAAKTMRMDYDRSRSGSTQVGGVTISGVSETAPDTTILVRSELRPRNVLLLSGGGQWGAYGAGLFLGMVCTQKVTAPYDKDRAPCLNDQDGKRIIDTNSIDFTPLNAMDIGVITGVSTGSLQSVLLMVILDKTQLKETRIAALQEMINRYAPEKQSKLVDYDNFLAAVYKGSVAGTDPLRRVVKEVLEKKWGFRDAVLGADGRYTGAALPERRLVDQIAYSPITTMVGVVEGRDGDFKSVNMQRMVREIQPDDGEGGHPRTERATNCVLATTLASSAMPVFHQQLRVIDAVEQDKGSSSRTLFDGGVRRSVFISELGNAFTRRYAILARHMGKELFAAASNNGDLPKMYVLRNGPTTSKEYDEVDKVENARVQAMRAYELLVNELEVSSIASLRLANPYGPILLSTADGSQYKDTLRLGGVSVSKCEKDEEMFGPKFMRCLQAFGVRRGMQLQVDRQGQTIPNFWELSPIQSPPELIIPQAANDNEEAQTSPQVQTQ